jgi:signal transduction histidine kinase
VRLFVLAALLAAALAPWGLGRFRGIRAAYLEAMRERARREDADRAERARQAVADERARMAREMHDVVAHSLAVMVRLAEGGRCAATKNPRLAVDALTMVASTGREALGDMRGVMAALRGGPGGSSSVELQPQPTVDDVGALIEPVRAAGLTVGLRTTGSPRPLDRAVSLAAYRVVQECLTNVVKHAGPDATADVRLEWLARELVVTVADDGGGCPGPDAFAAGGQGLPGMRERVTLAGGRLTAGRRDDGAGGFTVRARLPVAPQPAPSRGSDEGGTA